MTADASLHDGPASDTGLELDLGFIRNQFPAFAARELEGWAHFENAAGSFVCRHVIDRLNTFYTEFKVQPYAPYPASRTAGEWMDEAYRLMAGWLNVAEEEVHFGPSTTMNVYVLANGLRPMWEDDDEIIVTNQDHEANSGAWRRLAERGIVVKEWAIDPGTGMLDLADLDRLLTDRVRLVAFPHASNVIAHVNPVAEITARARAVGAVTVVDGVSYAPHGLPDLAALGADIYLFSTYKTWGPHLGVMTIRRELLDRMANQSHFFNAGKPRYTMTPAGPDHAQIAAAAGVIHYLDAVYEHHAGGPGGGDGAAPADRARVVHDLFRRHEQQLLAPLAEWLDERNDLRVLGPLDPAVRAPTVALVPKAGPVDEIVAALVDHKLMVASGNFYAARPLQAMGIDLDPGVLRLSFVHYTSPDDIDRLIEALDQALPPSQL